MTGKTIFITGSLGFLGESFIRDLPEQEPEAQVYLLVRERQDASIEARIRTARFGNDRIIAVPGEITDARLLDLAESLPAMDAFWHMAGLTTFNESRPRPSKLAPGPAHSKHLGKAKA